MRRRYLHFISPTSQLEDTENLETANTYLRPTALVFEGFFTLEFTGRTKKLPRKRLLALAAPRLELDPREDQMLQTTLYGQILLSSSNVPWRQSPGRDMLCAESRIELSSLFPVAGTKLLFLYYCLFVVDSYVGLQEKNGPKSFQENLPKEQRQTMTLNFSAIYFCYQ